MMEEYRPSLSPFAVGFDPRQRSRLTPRSSSSAPNVRAPVPGSGTDVGTVMTEERALERFDVGRLGNIVVEGDPTPCDRIRLAVLRGRLRPGRL